MNPFKNQKIYPSKKVTLPLNGHGLKGIGRDKTSRTADTFLPQTEFRFNLNRFHPSLSASSIFTTILLFLILMISPPSSHAANYQDGLLNEGWKYLLGDIQIESLNQISEETQKRLENQPWKELDTKDEFGNPYDRKGNQWMWLQIKLPEKTFRDPILLLDWCSYACDVYQGNRRIYNHPTIGKRGSGQFNGIQAVIIPLLEDRLHETIYFRIYSTDPYYIGLDEVFYCDRTDLFSTLIKKEIIPILLGFFFMIFGIPPLFFILSNTKNAVNLYFSLFIISLGIITMDGYLIDLLTGPSTHWYDFFNIAKFLSIIGLSLYFENLLVFSPYNRWLKRVRSIIAIVYIPTYLLLIIFSPSYIYYELSDFFLFNAMIITIILTYLSCIHAVRREKISKFVALFYTFFVITALHDIFKDSYTSYHWAMLFFILSLSAINEKRMRSYGLQLKNSEIQLLHSQLEVIKSRINPHFLFNSLNALSSLIFADKERAAQFVKELASVFRNILEIRKEHYISLEKEIALSKSYIYLMKTRLGDGLMIKFFVEERLQQKKIVPLAVQLMIENAIKHNIVSKTKPLSISIHSEGDTYLVVKNSLQRKKTPAYSSKIGIDTIRKNYSLITDKGIIITETDESFIVKLPLLDDTELRAL